ncbi:hypothetical protein HFO60_11745 [Rhizobium leguminosarum]|uniref:hypothetical protein n=1 Tax=Rhizobium leguminosarum TaxID=384 RepID=UPI001C93AEF8|nr:hypothetical protein [Rhizobium leguminosarum]MBY5540697.1 hypothetical protein [Rhizobium leguminosarum]
MAEASPVAAVQTFLDEQGAFTLSLVIGMAVIAFYSRKRIGELIRPPKGEEYDFIRTLPIETIVGESNFYKSYVIYVLMLEFLYFFICTSKPLVLLIANDTAGAAFKGAAWPLGAALLVVGLLPSTPFLSEVETLLRGIAQKIASIPSEFFNRVAKLTRSEIETLFDAAPEYRPERRKYRQIHNILVSLDFPPDEAMMLGRTCISTDLFSQWILNGSRIWSSGEYEGYTDIIAKLKPSVEGLLAETAALINESYDAAALREIMDIYGVTLKSEALTMDAFDQKRDDILAVKALWTPETAAAVEDLSKRWKDLVSSSDLAVRKLCAVFAIVARNDKEAVKRLAGKRLDPENRGSVLNAHRFDPVLKEVLSLVNDRHDEESSWSEAAAVAIFGGFITCLLSLSIYLYLVDFLDARYFAGAAQTVPTVTTAMRSALSTALTVGLSFGFASIVALFLRSLKIEEGSWTKFTSFYAFRFSNYFGIIIWCSMAAFMPLVFRYVFYNFLGQTSADQVNELKPFVVLSALFFKYLFGMAGVGYAVSTCILADIIEESRQKIIATAAALLLLIIIICFVSLVATPWLEIPTKLFWHNMMAVSSHAAASLLFFYMSYSSFIPGTRISTAGSSA